MLHIEAAEFSIVGTTTAVRAIFLVAVNIAPVSVTMDTCNIKQQSKLNPYIP